MTNPAPDLVPCRCCNGNGRVPLTGIYADTLTLLRSLATEFSGAALAEIDGCKATAMNNRLARLEVLGFATSRVYWRKRLYKAVKP